LVGINVFIFYSAFIFESIGVEPNRAVFLLNLANFVAVFPTIWLLNYYGRVTLMAVWTFVMTISLLVMTLFTQWIVVENAGTIQITALMIFVSAFEMSWGPVMWLYLAEVLEAKAISMCIFTNWTMSLLVGYLTPYLFGIWLGNYTFLLYGGFCGLAFTFIITLMKETKGLSEVECKRLYYPK
jgi:MFS family permease